MDTIMLRWPICGRRRHYLNMTEETNEDSAGVWCRWETDFDNINMNHGAFLLGQNQLAEIEELLQRQFLKLSAEKKFSGWNLKVSIETPTTLENALTVSSENETFVICKLKLTGNCLPTLHYFFQDQVKFSLSVTCTFIGFMDGHEYSAGHRLDPTYGMFINDQGKAIHNELKFKKRIFDSWLRGFRRGFVIDELNMEIPKDVVLTLLSTSSFGAPEPISHLILDEEILSDIKIIAGNGAEVKAHKIFLAARSPVLRTMLETDMKESRESVIEMPDLSQESIRALLGYLYKNDTSVCYESSLVAYELFYAGHKYQISSLEKLARFVILKEQDTWFDPDTALKMYLFARNMTPVDEDVKKKAISAMKENTDKLQASETYQELFQSDSKFAMDLCTDLGHAELLQNSSTNGLFQPDQGAAAAAMDLSN